MKYKLQTFSRPLFLIFLLFLNSISIAQDEWDIGGYNKFSNNFSSTPLSISSKDVPLRSLKFCLTTGGVNFDAEASPENFDVHKMELFYDKTKQDGKRLLISINNSIYQPLLYDWQLLPIAKFANSYSTGCVSLFGSEGNRSNFHIIYHPAFANTLLGMRLLQTDLLFMKPINLTQIPKYNGKAILGKGERIFNADNAAIAGTKIHELKEKIAKIEEYRSYICTDENEKIKFFIRNNKFVITGSIHYFFWRSDIATRYQNLIHSNETFRFQLNDEFLEKIMVNECSVTTTTFMKEIMLLEQVNPLTFSATTNVMRYAAFFRYCKARFNDSWTQFFTKIEHLNTEPPVVTPTSWNPNNKEENLPKSNLFSIIHDSAILEMLKRNQVITTDTPVIEDSDLTVNEKNGINEQSSIIPYFLSSLIALVVLVLDFYSRKKR